MSGKAILTPAGVPGSPGPISSSPCSCAIHRSALPLPGETRSARVGFLVDAGGPGGPPPLAGPGFGRVGRAFLPASPCPPPITRHEPLDLRSHRPTPHKPGTRAANRGGTQFEWGWAPNRSGFGSPTLASVVGQLAAARLLMTSTSGPETRNVPGSIFRGPCSDPAPFPLAGGTKFVLRRVLGHRLGRGPAAARMSRPSRTSKRVQVCCQRWSGQATKKDLALSLPCWVIVLVRDRIVVMAGLS